MPLHSKTLRTLLHHDWGAEDRFVRMHYPPSDWCVLAGWQDALFAPTAADWFCDEPGEPADCIKHRTERTTWRATVGGRSAFVKTIRNAGWRDRLKRWLLGSAAEREWRTAVEAERLGVPIAKPIAVGVLDGTGRSVFLSQWVAKARTLPEYWEAKIADHMADHQRNRATVVIDAVAHLFAAAHERGFVHRDGHPQNILIREPSSTAAEALFVDVHGAIVRRKPATRHQSVRSLAQLMHAASWTATRADGLRFLRAYVDSRPSLAIVHGDRTELSRLAGEIFEAKQLHAERLARQRDRRLWRGRRYFSTMNLGSGWTATFVLRLARRKILPGPPFSNRTEAQWRNIVTPIIGTAANGDVVPATLRSADLMIERQTATNPATRIRWTLHGSPHRRRFERCHRLRHRDQPAQLILAVMEHRTIGLVDQTAIILPAVDRVSPSSSPPMAISEKVAS